MKQKKKEVAMFKKRRGTIEIYEDFSGFFFNFSRFLEDISWSYGYTRVETPIFESKDLFVEMKMILQTWLLMKCILLLIKVIEK